MLNFYNNLTNASSFLKINLIPWTVCEILQTSSRAPTTRGHFVRVFACTRWRLNKCFKPRGTPRRRERARFRARGNIKTRRRHEKRSLRTASLRLRFKFKFNPLAASPPFETSVLVSTSSPPTVFHFVTFTRTGRCARVNLSSRITSDRISPTFSASLSLLKIPLST